MALYYEVPKVQKVLPHKVYCYFNVRLVYLCTMHMHFNVKALFDEIKIVVKLFFLLPEISNLSVTSSTSTVSNF